MSAFVVLFNGDGSPADGARLAEMTASLACQGPDARQVWRDGPIGMGHALLRTTWEAGYERQPFTLGDDVWIVADARVDGREELWKQLDRPADAQLAETADSALILHAYRKWGEQCVDHLIGDFSFVIWDGRRQRLFGAKDPFGVRLLYHAKVGETWVISNVLDCIRLHPGVSDRLNELAVIDFLLFDCNQELDTTFFAGIAKLPPAHTFTVAGGVLRSRRYWQIPEPDLLWLKREEEYIEVFRGLLEQAVSDRLRTDRASVWFSGGLDSTNLAVAALEVGRKRGRPFEFKAITAVYDRLLPDRERHFAGIAAEALGIPIEFVVADDIPLYEEWDRIERRTPEPRAGGLAGISGRTYSSAARCGRVVLYGEGADEILPSWNVKQLGRHLRGVDLRRCVLGSVVGHRRLPPLGTGMVAAWRGRNKPKVDATPPFPEWMTPHNRTWAEVRDRFEHLTHPDRCRPSGRCASRFFPALWTNLLEECADEGGRAQVEVGLPYLDLRLMEFALRVPPFPWSADKYLLRRMGEGRLPRAILKRPKSGVPGDPSGVRLPDLAAWRKLEARVPWSSELEEFVSLAKLRALVTATPRGAGPVWEALRPFSLAAWMQNGRKQPLRPTPTREGENIRATRGYSA